MENTISPSVILPGRATKTGLSHRALYAPPHPLVRFLRAHGFIGAAMTIALSALIVAGVAVLLQRLEIRYTTHRVHAEQPTQTVPAKDIEVPNIQLPEHGATIQLSNGAPRATAQLAAAQKDVWSAEYVDQNATVVRLDPGRGATLTVRFKNTGNTTWHNSGNHFLALNVANPAGRTSPFQHTFWKEFFYRPTRLLEETVKPGEIGTFRFAVQAPDAPGRYQEDFGLVAENLTWLPGGSVHFTMVVNNPYVAHLESGNNRTLKIDPGKAMTVEVKFKNTGTATWTRDGGRFLALNVANPAGRTSPFQHTFWKEFFYRPTRLLEETVKPGEIGTFRFAVQAPLDSGLYTEAYALVAENYTWVKNGNVTITFQVGSIAGETRVSEPRIRVGLKSTDDPVTMTANTSYVVYAGKQALGTLDANTILTVTPQGDDATVRGGTISTTTDQPIRAVPKNNGIMTITSYEIRPGWNPGLNFNAFRGVIEVRWSTRDTTHWIINELPMDQYIAGIAETSNGNPPAYLQSMAIAARSYAYYHYNRGVEILHTTLESTKHGDRGFHVHTTYDQVYRGYTFERVAYDIANAAKDTAGLVVAYQGDPVITPYYSHSDGRTRAWTEVWYGGPYPWLVSVADPCCTNMPLFGHGVGMSALGAIWFADTKNWTAAQILSYYYQGTELKELY